MNNDNIKFKINELLEWEIKDWANSGYIDLLELTKENFWRRLMNCRVDRKTFIGGIYTISETVIASLGKETVTAFVIDKWDAAEIILVYRDSSTFPWSMLRAVVIFDFYASGAYQGMKKGMTIKVECGDNETRFINLRKDNGGDVLKEAVKNVMTSEKFGLKSIEF